MRYKESDPFYHTAAWKRARAEALRRDRGMCRVCMERFERGYGFRPRRAAVVHHVVPLDVYPHLALDINNLRSLCEVCHNQSHPEKGGNAPVVTTGSKMRVIKV